MTSSPPVIAACADTPPGSVRRGIATVRARPVLAPALATAIALATGLLIARAPRPSAIVAALSGVSLAWLSLALVVNAVSIVARAEAWRLLMTGPGPGPSRRACLSAYSVGLLGNTLLPARAGEAGRALVVARHIAAGPGRWTAVAGSILAQRCLDVVAFSLLVAVVLASGQAPGWVTTGTLVIVVAGLLLVAAAVVVSRYGGGYAPRAARPLRWLIAVIREGLAVLRVPSIAARAAALQITGWVAQLMVVDLTLRAFSAPAPLVASALVLVLLNGILAFPLWPGGVGAYQAVVALALVPYGIASTTGLGLGVGIQAVESLVGIGFGLVFAAGEGLSLAALRRDRAGAR